MKPLHRPDPFAWSRYRKLPHLDFNGFPWGRAGDRRAGRIEVALDHAPAMGFTTNLLVFHRSYPQSVTRLS